MDEFDLRLESMEGPQRRGHGNNRRQIRRHDVPDPTPTEPFQEKRETITDMKEEKSGRRRLVRDTEYERPHDDDFITEDTDERVGTERPNRSKRNLRKPKASRKSPGILSFIHDRRFQVYLGIVAIVLGGVLMVVLVSHLSASASDQSKVLNQTVSQIVASGEKPENAGGAFGAWLSHVLFADSLGLGGFVISIYLLAIGGFLCAGRRMKFWEFTFRMLLLAVTISVVSGLVTYTADTEVFWGGTHGHYVNRFLFDNAGYLGAIAVSIILIAAVVCVFYYPLRTSIAGIRKLSPALHRPDYDIKEQRKYSSNDKKATSSPAVIGLDETSKDKGKEDIAEDGAEIIKSKEAPKDRSSVSDGFSIDDSESIGTDEIRSETSTPAVGKQTYKENDPGFEVKVTKLDTDAEDEPADIAQAPTSDYAGDKYDPRAELSGYRMPRLDLLEERPQKQTVDMQEQQANKDRIVKTLAQYKIGVSSIKATVGPTVTLYEIVPAEGVRIAQIKNLEDDIAMNLAAKGIRIIAPIPGEGTVGIEVPNSDPQTVSMRSVLASRKFQESNKILPVALGATIQNEVFVADLASMPHALVAGATGQGKSVGLNAIIASLLYKKHPSELKFVLIDPKMVEFSLYSRIERHYLAKLPDPDDEAIITDSQKVLAALNSLCAEMDERYELLKKAGARDIEGYNRKFVNRVLNPEKGHHYLPYLVVVIDEFADLIMTGGKEIENPVTRITQKGRSAGIHMIIATQRPSTNVLTGLIKANCPTRIAFRVMQGVDSRTILDRNGANQLIGRGDMLYSASGAMERVQCAFISTEEVERIVDFIGDQPGFEQPYLLPDPELAAAALNGENIGAMSGAGLDKDPLFDQIASYTVHSSSGKISTSIIQRNFGIGYNRAARVVDQMEAAGIVGPASGMKPRDVLVDSIALGRILSQGKQQ